MKNKIFGGAFIIAIAVLATININIVQLENGTVNLKLANMKAFANAENGINDPNIGSTYYTQGATKDEREWIRPCPTNTTSSGSGSGSYGGASASGSGSSSQTNPITRTELSCPYGYVNCTPIGC